MKSQSVVITSLSVSGFKSLESVGPLQLGSLNVFIGANASGKSNLLEALRFLQGVSFGFTIDEVLNGKPKTAASEVWEGLRGGSKQAGFKRPKGTASRPRFGVELRTRSHRSIHFGLQFSPNQRVVVEESLSTGPRPVYETATLKQDRTTRTIQARYNDPEGKHHRLTLDASRTVLAQVRNSLKFDDQDDELAEECAATLGNVQRLDFDPRVLHLYSQGSTAQRMGERGENFAAVVAAIKKSKDSYAAYLDWLQQLSPAPSDEVKVLEGACGEALFALRHGGNEFPAASLSDGTLRFAAIAAAFFQPSMPSLVLIEEVATGIHPSRLRLLLDLLKSQAEATGT